MRPRTDAHTRTPTGAQRPSLSLVVPVFNEQDRFAEHADELAAFVRSYGRGSELLVVDDGSADATVEVVEKFVANQADTVVRLLRRPHTGKGRRRAGRAPIGHRGLRGLLRRRPDHAP